MAWTIEYSQTARKFVDKADNQTRRRIREMMEGKVAFLENPRDLGKPLKGGLRVYWSYRAGDMRILCQIQDQRLVVLVVMIGNRREIYR